MNLCRNPEHPHCTVWVMPGEGSCAHGHPQPGTRPPATGIDEAQQAPAPAVPERPHLHVSGYDPRAAGGRQAIKLELRGMPADTPAQLTMLVKSALRLYGADRHQLVRSARGDWRPAFIEFSSKGLEHGQHRIELELHAAGNTSRTWMCSLVILVPRADATLGEIHQAFLSSHKNVRVFADDGSIARVNAQATSGTLDIDVSARNAGIARLDLGATAAGKIDLALPTIAWDEDLLEIETPASRAHPYPVAAACLVQQHPSQGAPRHMRLFAGSQWVLGRFDADCSEADVLLAHHGRDEERSAALTRRISARHAIVRSTADGFTIEDLSRYGLLVDGKWHGRHLPLPLRQGMQIEITASIKGVVSLVVAALSPNALLLRRTDAGAQAECFWLVVAGREPADALAGSDFPTLFHDGGGFWMRDASSGHDIPLTHATELEPRGWFGRARFAGGPYPETWSVRARVPDRRRVRTGNVIPIA
jgi:hypothetical protein